MREMLLSDIVHAIPKTIFDAEAVVIVSDSASVIVIWQILLTWHIFCDRPRARQPVYTKHLRKCYSNRKRVVLKSKHKTCPAGWRRSEVSKLDWRPWWLRQLFTEVKIVAMEKETGKAVIGHSLNLPRPKIMRYALHSIDLNGRRMASEKSSLNKMNVCLKKLHKSI